MSESILRKGRGATLNPQNRYEKNARVDFDEPQSSVLVKRLRKGKGKLMTRVERIVSELVANGTVKPVIDSVLSFDQVREGFERLRGGQVFGKVVFDHTR